MRARPVGLQLPFYAAVLADEHAEVVALILAKLHARETQVKGLADADYGFEGLAAPQDWPAFVGYTWEGLMAQWQIGRASWREGVCKYGSISVGAVLIKKKKNN